MTLAELISDLDLIVMDSSLKTHFTDWINNAILEIAKDFALPALKLMEPITLSVTDDEWLYDMPATYHKKLYKCYDGDWNKITIHRSLDDIDSLDIDHDDTGDLVTDVAVRDNRIGVYPMADDTLRLWYFKKPTTLVNDGDEPTCIPDAYHYRVIISKVVIRNYHLLMDMSTNAPHQSLQWWKNNYRGGLFGDGADIGMINYFAMEKKPKRRGGNNPIP